jgi:hypothetical protein
VPAPTLAVDETGLHPHRRQPRSQVTHGQVAPRTLRPELFAGTPKTVATPTTTAGADTQAVLLADNFAGVPRNQPLPDGSVHGTWRSDFHGYGTTQVTEEDGQVVLSQQPQTSTHPDETHASMVSTTQSFGDMELDVSTRTVRQLRQGEPNPWETSWVTWHQTDNQHAYYLALKTNGWELGKLDPSYPGGQRFLATGNDPAFPVGTWNDVKVRQQGATMHVQVNGRDLATFTDQERPYLSGSVGLYNEDAHVQFKNVVVTEP